MLNLPFRIPALSECNLCPTAESADENMSQVEWVVCQFIQFHRKFFGWRIERTLVTFTSFPFMCVHFASAFCNWSVEIKHQIQMLLLNLRWRGTKRARDREKECVCVCERERERERKRNAMQFSIQRALDIALRCPLDHQYMSNSVSSLVHVDKSLCTLGTRESMLQLLMWSRKLEPGGRMTSTW